MENTLYTIGGIAAVFNALVAGGVLGYHFGRWSKGKEAVAPAAPGAARLVVVELRGGDDGRRGEPPAPGRGDAADGGGEGCGNGDGPGDDPDDNA